jgi:transposase-like protein
MDAWRRRLDRQARSGLSVSEFCRREKVSQPSFYQWRKRLATQRHTDSPPLFVPVSFESEGVEGTGEGIEIDLPNGAVVRLPRTAAASLVAAAISAAANVNDEGRSPVC